jgi:hypothetical protein
MTVEKMQNRPKVSTTNVISPYLLHDTINSERYLQMLQDYVWPMVSGWENTTLFSCRMVHHLTSCRMCVVG